MVEELIPYDDLASLRLADLARRSGLELPEVVEHDNWIYMGRRWRAEAIGAFTDFLRPEETPDIVGALSLELPELPAAFQKLVLTRLGIPIRQGATIAEIEHFLGAYVRTCNYVDDRVTYDFQIGKRWPYSVGCTLLNDGGLVFLTMIRFDLVLPDNVDDLAD